MITPPRLIRERREEESTAEKIDRQVAKATASFTEGFKEELRALKERVQAQEVVQPIMQKAPDVRYQPEELPEDTYHRALRWKKEAAMELRQAARARQEDGGATPQPGRTGTTGQREEGRMGVVAALAPKPLAGRWETPAHLEVLSMRTRDYDWWFREMYRHMDKCGVVLPSDWMKFIRSHSEDEFCELVYARAEEEGVDAKQLLSNHDAFREYITLRYTKPHRAETIMQELLGLSEKKSTLHEAWKTTARLVFCYNQIMRRQQLQQISPRMHAKYFIGALGGKLRDHLYSAWTLKHPDVETADMAYQAAWDFLEAKPGKGIEEDEGEYPVMAVAREEKNGERKGVKKVKGGAGTACVVAAGTAAGEQAREKERKEADKCWKCGAGDHWARDCPDAKAQCTHCGKTGHREPRCWDKFPSLRPEMRLTRRWRSPPGQRGPATETAKALVVDAEGAQPGGGAWVHPADPRTQQPAALTMGTVETHQVSRSGAREIADPQLAEGGQGAVKEAASWGKRGVSKGDTSGEVAGVTTACDGRRTTLCDCLLQLYTTLGGKALRVIVDSGAMLNLLLDTHVDDTVTRVKVPPVAVMTASKELQYLSEKVTLMLEFQGYPYVFEFHLTPALPADALIGVQGMNQAGWVVNVPQKTIHHLTHALPPIRCAPCQHTATLVYAARTTVIPARTWARVAVVGPWEGKEHPEGTAVLTPTLPPAVPLHGAPSLVDKAQPRAQYVLLCNTSEDPVTIPRNSPVAYREEAGAAEEGNEPEEEVVTGEQAHMSQEFDLGQARANWTPREVRRLIAVFVKWRKVWEEVDTVGRTQEGEHVIETGTAKPIAVPMRRMAWVERDLIREEVNKMKNQKVVTDSTSPWASPPVLVKKKDGTVLCPQMWIYSKLVEHSNDSKSLLIFTVTVDSVRERIEN